MRAPLPVILRSKSKRRKSRSPSRQHQPHIHLYNIVSQQLFFVYNCSQLKCVKIKLVNMQKRGGTFTQIQKYIGKGIDVVVAGARGLQTSRPSKGEILVLK